MSVEVRPVDVAQGLLSYKDQPETLRDWAMFVLGNLDVLDLTPLESWPEGDELLNALWDAVSKVR